MGNKRSLFLTLGGIFFIFVSSAHESFVIDTLLTVADTVRDMCLMLVSDNQEATNQILLTDRNLKISMFLMGIGSTIAGIVDFISELKKGGLL